MLTVKKEEAWFQACFLVYPKHFQHLFANCFQSCTEMYTGAHERRALD